MVASRTFDSILQQIQSSNLNFQLQISPFAANISLMRSPVKDRTGTPILQPKLPSQSPSETVAEIAVLASKNIQLEKDLNSLRLVHEGAIEDCEAAYNKIRLLESNPIVKTEDNKKLKMELSKKDELLNDLSSKLSQVSVDNEHLKMKLDKQSSEIQNLQKSSKEISNKLNKELVSTKVKFQAEKEEILKQHKAEVKSWRQELGEVTTEKIKLEEELESQENLAKPSSVSDVDPKSTLTTVVSQSSKSQETVCSICAADILDYTPEYFMGKAFNPACEDCKDNSWSKDVGNPSETETSISVDDQTKTPPVPKPPFTRRGFNFQPASDTSSSHSLDCSHTHQCITRQPFPPPLSALRPLKNLSSMYHMKTMARELVVPAPLHVDRI